MTGECSWCGRTKKKRETKPRSGLAFTALNWPPIGQDFRINTQTTDGQREPEVAEYGKGGFFVVWESRVSAGNDVEPSSIEGRIVTGSNQFASPQFLVNSWTPDSQQDPGMGGKNGRIAVGWNSSSNPETTTNVIQGQFWSICGIFCDSFE